MWVCVAMCEYAFVYVCVWGILWVYYLFRGWFYYVTGNAVGSQELSHPSLGYRWNIP